jgi:dienelactone hydrolase
MATLLSCPFLDPARMQAMRALPLIVWLFLSACTSLPTFVERRELADELARSHDWHAVTLPAGPFDLVAYLPDRPQAGDHLTLYIEGDGFAWISTSQPSPDPTPRNPIGLKMALAHPKDNAAYLARPCQYVDTRATHCPQRYWTQQRFAPEVVAALGKAADELKARFHARRLTLVGYSGGGAIAALLAARRNDVDGLITVAGNLDHRAWTRHHGIAPLTGSLNPADMQEALAGIPQVHFVGSEDRVVPPGITEAFASRFPASGVIRVRLVPGFDHHCCWAENWKELWTSVQ